MKSMTHHECPQDGQPVSPATQFLSSSQLSLCVHGIFEGEDPIDISNAKKAIKDTLLPRNPRFSCVMTKDDRGVFHWQKMEVNVEDHVIVPNFPPGLTVYDEYVNEYISTINLNPLRRSDRPLWEFHILNYKTTNAEGTCIINVHHSLGDGISLMSMLLACVTRADNPTLLPTFPTAKPPEKPEINSLYRIWHFLYKFVVILWHTCYDFVYSLLRSTWIDDTKLPLRGPPGVVEFLPKVLSFTTFQIDDIRHIKNSIGGTVNDVITGVIFYGIQRYLQICLSGENNPQEPTSSNVKKMEKLRVTALTLINTRALSGLKEMLKPDTQTPWGNHFGFIHITMPVKKFESPLEYIRKAKQIIDRKKMSLGVFLTSRALGYLARFKGPQAPGKYVYNTIANTTLAISNMIGPMEKMAMAGNPVKSFYFSVSGAPQSLFVTIVSYMGTVRVQVVAAKGYVDADLLSKCFSEAFQEIKEASIHSTK
eukprot:Gb_05378 [translate_table: standard]